MIEVSEGLLPRALLISFVVVGGSRPRAPAYRCARLLLQKAFCREQKNVSMFDVDNCLCASLIYRALLIFFVEVEGCRPRSPAYRCSRLLLRKAFCREQKNVSMSDAANCLCTSLPCRALLISYVIVWGLPAFRCARLLLRRAWCCCRE